MFARSWRWLWNACLLFGLILTVWLPPFQSPDEPNHFLKAWHVSEGHFFPEKNGQRVGGTLPTAVGSTISQFAYLKNNPNARVSWADLHGRLNAPLNASERTFQDFANTAMYAPLGYAPQALAIAFSRNLGLSSLFALYAGRVANFLLWWWIISIILSKIGDFRWFFLVWAAMPASLVMAASVNPDVLMNALAWWCIAAWVAPKGQMGNSATPAFFAALCLQKLIAWPLAVLTLMKEKWQSTARWLALGVAAALLWSVAASAYFIPYDQYDPQWRDSQTLNSGVNPDAQMAYVLEHLLQTAKTMTVSGIKAAPAIVAHITVKFGWEKNYLHWMVVGLCCFVILVVATVTPISWTRRNRMILLLAALLYLMAFALTNYLLWHRVGAPEFHNWQGRYFTPVLPLVLMSCCSGWLNRWRTKAFAIISLLMLFCQFCLFWAIAARYWIN
ncbi:MAG: DUF2142 domain-containing protein [Saprospiraceae bacterium]|nr:DUF2142 domain-containing protein [Saprospiraceae bacterium]